MSEKRKSNLEILRILCMLCIIMSHFCTHGVFSNILSEGDSPSLFTNEMTGSVTNMLANIAVACFILITGMFIEKTSFSWVKIFRIVGQVWFYSWSLLLLLFLFFPLQARSNISFEILIRSLTPVTASSNWFASAYIVMTFFYPIYKKEPWLFSST